MNPKPNTQMIQRNLPIHIMVLLMIVLLMVFICLTTAIDGYNQCTTRLSLKPKWFRNSNCSELRGPTSPVGRDAASVKANRPSC